MRHGKRWDDHYTRRAKAEKWLARSVYKLEEIDRKFSLIGTGNHVLDLGCYPGSWIQYCEKKAGKSSDLVGVDLTEPDRLQMSNFRFIQADILELDPEWLLEMIGTMDVVLSDLAPPTTGVRVRDAQRSQALAGKAILIALTLLREGGHLLCKIFEGEDLKKSKDALAESFKQTRLIRPKAVRKGSREIYLLGLNRGISMPRNP